MAYSFDDAKAKGHRGTQYFEMLRGFDNLRDVLAAPRPRSAQGGHLPYRYRQGLPAPGPNPAPWGQSDSDSPLAPEIPINVTARSHYTRDRVAESLL